MGGITPLTKVCSGKVAVVGNGAISESDRRGINSGYYDCVVRFNDMKNITSGETATVHATRYTRYSMNKFPGLSLHKDGFSPIILPIVAKESDMDYGMCEDHACLPPYLVHEKNDGESKEEVMDTSIFDDCYHCKSRIFDCKQSYSSNGASSGTLIIDLLESDPSVSSIDVFGMNWNGSKLHMDFLQSNLVSSCCTKCDIHKSPSSEYNPFK